eukprot:TRINITY_DN225_c0_g1_i1.p1 TRINITY_DN225_c0_g1~~TRINITY_DN225_c0_g1_i1.p1  ORF type:complete len:171 (+),score=34.07 TRINITY_DN225_c0_g1_i1:189-701(+)
MLRVVQRSIRACSVIPALFRASAARNFHSTPFALENKDNKGTHPDFQPKKKLPYDTDEESLINMVKTHINKYPIMLYMKGTPTQPECGFSYQVVKILQASNVNFSSIDVLKHPLVAMATRKVSDWETFPQLFVKGEFLGGCDVIGEMYETGELKEVFEEYDLILPPPEEE